MTNATQIVAVTLSVPAKQVAVLFAFAVYLVTIVIFARVYLMLYRKNASSFLFASDLTAARREELATSITSESNREQAVAAGVGAIARGLSEDTVSCSIRPQKAFTRADDVEMVFEIVPERRKDLERLVKYRVSIEMEHRAQTFFFWSEIYIRDRKDLRQLVDDFAETIRAVHDNTQTRLTLIDGELRKSWRFMDFLYFSVITQSTVGYGDILPNTHKVRRAVVCQILVGYAIVVVLLNILLLF